MRVNWDRILQWGMVGAACLFSYAQMQGDVKSLQMQWQQMDKFGPSSTREFIIATERRLATIEALQTAMQRDINSILSELRENKVNYAIKQPAENGPRGKRTLLGPSQTVGFFPTVARQDLRGQP